AARHHESHVGRRAALASQRSCVDQRLRPALLARQRPPQGAHAMTTITTPPTQQQRRLVEMAWDPVTRIIGNLGIYTKIDFDNREVAECKATSSLFRGYSVFMKGK